MSSSISPIGCIKVIFIRHDAPTSVFQTNGQSLLASALLSNSPSLRPPTSHFLYFIERISLRQLQNIHTNLLQQHVHAFLLFPSPEFTNQGFFKFLPTVLHLSIFISVFNQLHAQNFFRIIFISCLTCFEHCCAHHQEVKIALHSLWYHHTYRCDDTRGCVMQF